MANMADPFLFDQTQIPRNELDALRYALIDQHVMVSVADERGNIISVNDKFCELTGYMREELLGCNYRLLKSDEHEPEFFQELWDTVKGGDQWSGEIKNRKKNGNTYWSCCSVMPFFDKKSQSTYFLTLSTDIDRSKKNERLLLENEKRFRFFAENVDEGIIVCCDNKIVDVSDVWAAMFDCKREDAIGKSPMDYTAPEMRTYAMGIIAKKGLKSYESIMLRADGHTFPALVRGKELVFEGHHVRLTTILDISKQKENEAALKKAKDEAEHANKVKSQFLSSMSHELRTPLNAVIGYAQLLEVNEQEPLSETQQQYTDQIMSGAQHLLTLINDILDLARIEAGQVHVLIESVSPMQVLRECRLLMANMALYRNISISIPDDLDSELKKWSIRADYTRLKQVLLNLMSNAIKYNRDNGTVSLSLEKNGEKTLRIAVRDTGKGIAEDKLNQLFKPFNRLGAEHLEIEGTGIGLVIAKNMVELMQGTIGVISKEGMGSTFWIEFPCENR